MLIEIVTDSEQYFPALLFSNHLETCSLMGLLLHLYLYFHNIHKSSISAHYVILFLELLEKIKKKEQYFIIIL